MGVRPPSGVLLYGAPGTGKTLLARAVAGTVAANFLSVRVPDILSSGVGDSEKALRDVFLLARSCT